MEQGILIKSVQDKGIEDFFQSILGLSNNLAESKAKNALAYSHDSIQQKDDVCAAKTRLMEFPSFKVVLVDYVSIYSPVYYIVLVYSRLMFNSHLFILNSR